LPQELVQEPSPNNGYVEEIDQQHHNIDNNNNNNNGYVNGQ
jgi:hypothetical protein